MQNSLLLLPILLALTAAELTCYYPDTTVATGHIPCNATASDTPENASACCYGYGNDYCLANGLCWFDGILSRASCTDKNWASPSCAQWCLDEQRNNSMNIFPCHQQGVWQCEWHDCASNFTLQTPGISVIIRDDQQPDAPNAIEYADPNARFVAGSQANSLSAVTTSDTAVPVSTTIATSTSSTNPSVPTSSLAASVSSTPADPPPTSTPTPAADTTLSVGAKGGVTVGAIVGASAVGTLLYLFFVRRRRRIHENAPRTKSPRVRGPADTGHLCEHCGSAKSELMAQPARTEMDAAGAKPELMARNLRWEMDGGSGVAG